MTARRLSAEEAEIWAKVAATVRRLEGGGNEPIPSLQRRLEPMSLANKDSATPEKTWTPASAGVTMKDTLDGGWDRRLRQGVIQPDRSIDLHGHNLASAHGLLDRALEQAVADEIRILLVITGKPPRDPAPHSRGLIRAAIGDWLAGSRHAGRIAAVRNAHPRHGGAGALYVILRRKRPG